MTPELDKAEQAPLIERLEKGDKRKCPFPDIDIAPETPCPICGDLGTLESIREGSHCVDSNSRLLHKEAADEISRLTATLAAKEAECEALRSGNALAPEDTPT